MDGLVRNLALILHLCGVFAIVGGLIGELVVSRFLWNNLESQPEQAGILARLVLVFGKFGEYGGQSMLASGLLLLFADQWVFWGQAWLYGKLVLYVLLSVNGAVVAKRAVKRLEQLIPALSPSSNLATARGGVATISATGVETVAELQKVHRMMQQFQLSQAVMLGLVIILAVFKFA